MNQVSERTLQMIDDIVRTLNFEVKTGKSVTLGVGPTTYPPDDFVRKRDIFVNGQKIGEIVDEIDPFI